MPTIVISPEEATLLDMRPGIANVDTVTKKLSYMLHIYQAPPSGETYRYAPANREATLASLEDLKDLLEGLYDIDIPLPTRRDVDIYCGAGYVSADQVVGTQRECWSRGLRVGDKHGSS